MDFLILRALKLQHSANAIVYAVALLAAGLAALLLAGVSQIHPALMAGAFLLIFGFFPACAICHSHGRTIAGADVFIYTLLGLLLASTIDALLLYFGLRSGWVLAAIMIPISVIGLVRSAREVSRPEFRYPEDAVALGLVALFIFQLVFSAVLMARGASALVFINVDTPFYLSHTQALVKETAWPVESLNVSGVRIGYHYGVQNAAALLARFADLPAHAALFGVVVGLLAMTIACAAVAIAHRLKGSWRIWLVLGLLLLLTLDPNAPWGSFRLFGTRVQSLPHPGGLFAVGAALICLYAITRKDGPNLRLLALAIFVTAFSRTTDFLALIAGFGLFASLKLVFERSPAPSIYFVVTAVASFAAIFTLTYGSNGGALLIHPGAYFFGSESYQLLAKLVADLSIVDPLSAFENSMRLLRLNIGVVAGILVLIAFGFSRAAVPFHILAFALAPLLILNVFVFDNPGFVQAPGEAPRDFSKALASMTRSNVYFWWGLLAAYIGAHDRIRPTVLAKSAYVALHVLVAWAVCIYALQALTLLRDHTRAHEFVDNRVIADALSHIPVDGTLLVTNDVRYPAQQFRRNDRQHQLSALFGHHNFASVLWYVPTPDYVERKRLNALLANKTWVAELDEAARRYGWTHYVVHKAAPHPADIPLPLVYENEAYAVYRFPPR